MRLIGRFGSKAGEVGQILSMADRESIFVGETSTTWAELEYSAGHEQIRQLSDLLLRRTRVGLLLPRGGAACLKKIKEICQTPLGWDDDRWVQEESTYLDNWQKNYSSPFNLDKGGNA